MKICAANWKMNMQPSEGIDFINKLLPNLSEEDSRNIWLFPQNFSVGSLATILSRTYLSWGAQNISHQEDGAYTGENSASILKKLGADLCLVGHSERRNLYKEDNETIALKLKRAQACDLKPLLCIGESLDEREDGKTFEVLKSQLEANLKYLDKVKPVAIAYEPIWAIGTGKTATNIEVSEAHNMIRSYLKDSFGLDIASKTKLLYGGSVKSDSAKELGRVENVDGFLIGGASLQVDSFLQIFNDLK